MLSRKLISSGYTCYLIVEITIVLTEARTWRQCSADAVFYSRQIVSRRFNLLRAEPILICLSLILSFLSILGKIWVRVFIFEIVKISKKYKTLWKFSAFFVQIFFFFQLSKQKKNWTKNTENFHNALIFFSNFYDFKDENSNSNLS